MTLKRADVPVRLVSFIRAYQRYPRFQIVSCGPCSLVGFSHLSWLFLVLIIILAMTNHVTRRRSEFTECHWLWRSTWERPRLRLWRARPPGHLPGPCRLRTQR